jgi:hypothetical protein
MSPKGLKPGELAVNSADGSIAVVGPDGLLTTLTGPNATVTAKNRSTTSAMQGAYFPAEGEVILNETTGTLWGFDRKSPGGAPQSDEQAMASGRFWATSWNADGTIKTGQAAVDDYKSGTLYAYNPGTQAVEPYSLGDLCVLLYGNYTGAPQWDAVPRITGGTNIEWSTDNVSWSSTQPKPTGGEWLVVRARWTGDANVEIGSRFFPSMLTSAFTKRVFSCSKKAGNFTIYSRNIDLSGVCTLSAPCWFDGSKASDSQRVPHLLDWCYNGKPANTGYYTIQQGDVSKTWMPPHNGVYDYPMTGQAQCVPCWPVDPPDSDARTGIRGDILDYLRTATPGEITGTMFNKEDYLMQGHDKVPAQLVDYLQTTKFSSSVKMDIGLASLSLIEDWVRVVGERFGRVLGSGFRCSSDVAGQDVTMNITVPLDGVTISNGNTTGSLNIIWPYGGAPKSWTFNVENFTPENQQKYNAVGEPTEKTGLGRIILNSTVSSPTFSYLHIGRYANNLIQVNTPDGSRAIAPVYTGNFYLARAQDSSVYLDFDDPIVAEAMNTIEFQDGPNFFGNSTTDGVHVKGDLYGKLHFSPNLTTLQYFAGSEGGATGRLDPDSYDSLLRWFADLETQGHWNGPVVLGVTTKTKYTSAGQAARTQLVNAGWTITDGGMA